MMDLALQITALVLSLFATLVTVVGFFASLRFYKSGLELQTDAQDLLSRVDEKISAIQSQIGGMFDKTLDAAIGLRRVSPQDAAEAQSRLLRRVTEEEDVEAEPDEHRDNLAQEVIDYFNLQGLAFSDVSTEEGRAIFSLGSQHGFNLFDGEGEIVFVGYFHRDDIRKTAARLQFLLNNIGDAYEQVRSASGDLRERGQALLDKVRIVLLIPEDADVERLLEAAERFQPDARQIEVTAMRPSELRAQLEEMYDDVWPDEPDLLARE